jgi:hypothetical protein
MVHPRRWLLILCLILACAILPACGGDDGGTVTGDSPEGIPLDSGLEDQATEGGQAVPNGSDEEPDVEESLTDGQ